MLRTNGKDSAATIGYDPRDDAHLVKSQQKRWRAGFPGDSLDLTKWEVVQQGTGQTVTVANGQLQIAFGTTASAETILLTKETFTLPLRLMVHAIMSQRIANNELHIEIISVDPATGIPDEKDYASWRISGTTATQAFYIVKNGNQPALTSAASTIVTTAGAGVVLEIEPTVDQCWFFGRTADATTSRTNNYVRHTQIPDANALYKLRIRAVNLAVAPASSTTFTSSFMNVSDYAELTAEITAGRGAGVAAQGIYATVGGTLSTVSTVTTVTTGNVRIMGLWYADSVANLGAAATFTGTSRDCGSATALNWNRFVGRVYASHAGTLYIEQASASTFRTTQEVAVGAGEVKHFDVEIATRYCRVRYVNGADAQTGFELLSALKGV